MAILIPLMTLFMIQARYSGVELFTKSPFQGKVLGIQLSFQGSAL